MQMQDDLFIIFDPLLCKLARTFIGCSLSSARISFPLFCAIRWVPGRWIASFRTAVTRTFITTNISMAVIKSRMSSIDIKIRMRGWAFGLCAIFSVFNAARRVGCTFFHTIWITILFLTPRRTSVFIIPVSAHITMPIFRVLFQFSI